MKHTYRKSVLRTIRQTMSRFLAIFAIVALGVGFLAGLLAATPDMRYSGDRYFDESELFDIRVVGTLGLSDEDIDAVRAVDGVADLMPGYTADALVDAPGGDVIVARFHSLPLDQIEEKEPQGYLNRLEVIEGRLPVKEDECVVERGVSIAGQGFQIGDTVRFSSENKDLEDTFARTELKVVGVVQSSVYFSMERESANIGSGTVNATFFTGEQNFSLDVWTDLYVALDGAKELNSLQTAYTDFVDETVGRIEDISGARCEIRYRDVKAQAETELADARKEYEDAKAEADEQLADAKEQLDDGRAQVEDAEKTLADAKKQIENGEKELDANKAALPGTLTQKSGELASGKAQLIAAKAQYEAGMKEVETQEAALKEAKEQLTQAKQLIQILEPVLQDAQAALPLLEGRIGELQDVAQKAQDAVPTLQSAADGFQAAADEAQRAADDARAASNVNDLQAAYDAACAAVDAARGDQAEEDWAAADPGAPALIAARESARLALQAEQARLAVYDTAAQTAAGQAANAQAAVQNAQAAVTTAQQRLAEAQAAVETGKQRITDTQDQLAAAKQQIAENEPKIAEGEQQLADAKTQLASAQSQIIAAEQQIAMGELQLSLAPDIAKLQLDLAEEKLKSSKDQVEDGETELADAKKELEDGEATYEREKKSAEEQLADAKRQLDDAQEQIDDLEVPEWYVLTRDQNVSFASFKSNIEKVEAIAKVFPLFFFLVAALVALTTMTRMVEEERLQIGTMKALGYGKGAIMAKYLIYAMTASVAGSAFGLAVGFNLFPTIIWNAYTMMYNLPKLYCLFNVPFAVFSSGMAIACTLAATLNACWATLAEVPAQLMLPKAPPAGKRILLEHVSFIWKRMKFTYKVTARNLLRYKKRFFMTVIGISGCTGLLVAGFGLHDSISDIVYKQFGEIFTYDATVSVRKESAPSGKLGSVLEDKELVDDWMLLHQEQGSTKVDGDEFNAYLFVPENDAQMEQFVDLHQRKGGAAVPFSTTGVVITEKMSERADLKIGDQVTLENADGQAGTFRVDGIAENYVENYVYLSADTYEEAFGTAPVFKSIALHAHDSSEEGRAALGKALLAQDDVASVSFIEDLKSSFNNMMQKIDIIVVVLIVCAGLLAFVVLYNLTNINITERTKEIATIKVLGFYDNEVSAYVYRESVALSIIGTLVGLVLGVFLHMFVIYTVEVDVVMFGRSIKFLSYVYAAALTMLFSALVNLVMHRKLRKISMVESMKAPE